MIGYLKGTPLAVRPERVLLDVQGVGYEVHIPLSTYYEIERAGDGRPLALHVHTHVREDSLELYGFWSERERLLFERLIAVSGIGPRLARVILSGLPPDELVAALAAGDVARLSRTPGIGKKTAERMILELQDKVRDLAAELPESAGPALTGDLVDALTALGYKPQESERAVATARESSPEAAFHVLLRLALTRLSRA
ncbi:MAG: Holliday junction branch migration protein RuvA [Thermoanaerobaculia bacterium]